MKVVTQKEANRRCYLKRKADPKRHAEYLAWCRKNQKAKWDKIRKDPIAHEAAKAKAREYMKLRREKLKRENIKEYQALLQKERHAAILARICRSSEDTALVAKKSLDYQRKRRKSDPLFRIVANLRARMYVALWKASKLDRSIKLIGCSPARLKDHLESGFQKGMSWENYGFGKGKWCVDHKVPCAAFDLTILEQQRACFHYTNLQPMWFLENNSKGSMHNGFRIRTKRK